MTDTITGTAATGSPAAGPIELLPGQATLAAAIRRADHGRDRRVGPAAMAESGLGLTSDERCRT